MRGIVERVRKLKGELECCQR